MMIIFDKINGIYLVPAIIILLRECIIFGLRQYLAKKKIYLPVMIFSKWKTTFQILSLAFLLIGDASPKIIPSIIIGNVLLCISGYITLKTGYMYCKEILSQ